MLCARRRSKGAKMATILKCKMCGGDIEVNQDMTVGTCLYCGSIMTLPRIESEKKARLFNRANQYRLNNEFDKAYDAYRAIVEEDEQEAEAYWGLILSEYGVEYVEDPKTNKRIPTCHRTHVQSIQSSVNFKNAIQFADAESRFIYQDEAEVLDKLQKSIISVSSKEKPYDVFICYKESEDATGGRTKDSVLAQQIYEALSDKGIRTFFSRISLEDKVGQNYEPFIYAALKSSRVMIVVTSSNEHCNATWVKNEWMRYIQFMEEDKNKSIIPVCYEMSPYELPDDLTAYQAQDMGKVGAIQDLVYGVIKLLGKAPRESNNEIINELLADKDARDKKNGLIIRWLIFALVAFAVGISGLIFLGLDSFANGYIDFNWNTMLIEHKIQTIVFACIFAIALVIDVIGMVYGAIKGYLKPLTKRLMSIGFILLNLAILYLRLNGFLTPGIKPLYFINALFVLIIAFCKFKMDNRKEAIPRLIAIILCTIMCVTNIGYIKNELSNITTITSENQIMIAGSYVNVRKEPTTDSEVICQTYQGLIFDIIDTEYNGKNTWYKICTLSGAEGYVRDDLVDKACVIEITESRANVRAEMSINSKIITQVYCGERYFATPISDKRNWYYIWFNNGPAYINTSCFDIVEESDDL